LPRFAGPIAAFLVQHPHSSRADLLAFIDRTFGVCVSRIALYRFLKKFGLDCINEAAPVPAVAQTLQTPSAPATPPAQLLPPPELSEPDLPQPVQSTATTSADLPPQILLPGPELVEALTGAGTPAPPFSSDGPSMPAPSC
jgi:hypothetical protein